MFKATFKAKILVETSTYHTCGAMLSVSYLYFKKMIEDGNYELEVVNPMFKEENEPIIIIRERKGGDK